MAEIPFFYDGVSAGKFDSSSNETDETMKVFLLMNENPDVMFAVRVRGDSMIDCGFMPGDIVLVEQCTDVYTGDIVVAIRENGDTILKTYFEDDRHCKFLIPRNAERQYEPIPLDGADCQVHLVGKVVRKISNNIGRDDTHKCANLVRQWREQQCLRRAREDCAERQIDDEVLRNALYEIKQVITVKRHWFAVYRILADEKRIKKGEYAAFMNLLNDFMEEEAPALHISELSSLDTECFAKPFEQWQVDAAPVSASAFRGYAKVATQFKELIYR